MRSFVVIAVAGLTLAGCSSLEAFKPTPKPVSIPVDSVPQGADAVSSIGSSCKTPCSISVPETAESFSVSFSLPRYQPLTVPVQVTHVPGDFASPPTATFDPNPIVGELQAAEPPKRQRRRPHRHAKPKAAPAGGTAAPSAPAASPPPATTPAR